MTFTDPMKPGAAFAARGQETLGESFIGEARVARRAKPVSRRL
jgi:hypothetical protein